MKFYVVICFCTFLVASGASAQVLLIKGHKTFPVDVKKIRLIRSPSVLLTTSFDYGRQEIKKKPGKYALFVFDSIKAFEPDQEGFKVGVTIILHYIDSGSGTIYSLYDLDKIWKAGKYPAVSPVLKDTFFYFASGEINKITLRIKEEGHGGGFGIIGLFLGGATFVVTGTVITIQGNNKGLFLAGMGAFLLASSGHYLNKSATLKDFKVGKRHWSTKAF